MMAEIYFMRDLHRLSIVPRRFYPDSKLPWANRAKFVKFVGRRHLRIRLGRDPGSDYSGNDRGIARIRPDILKIPDLHGDL